MAAIIYTLCAITALGCAVLLLRAYRQSGFRLLLWSGLCFVGLTLNNIILIVDKLFLPQIDLSIWRTSAALLAMTVLLYGLIWDAND
jgi:cytochrome bd-type quinol oxidase subunit 2